MNVRILAILMVLALIMSGAFAYQGFNRYYYTDNYHPTVYYPAPTPTVTATTYTYYGAASYPTYYAGYNTYYTYPTYTSTYYYPSYPTYTYAAPAVNDYRTFGIYGGGDGWGFYYSSGSVCGYYGYC